MRRNRPSDVPGDRGVDSVRPLLPGPRRALVRKSEAKKRILPAVPMILPTSQLTQKSALSKIAVIYMVEDRLALDGVDAFVELGR